MSQTKENYIVGIGEALWDMLPEGRKIGGAPANFTYHVSQFGLNAIVVSAVMTLWVRRYARHSTKRSCRHI